MVFVLSLCLPACPSSLPSPAGSKAGSLALDKMHIKIGWLRWLLAEHQVCSRLALLSACSRPSMIQPLAELLLFPYVTQSLALNTLLVYVILHSWYSPSCSDFRYCLLADYIGLSQPPCSLQQVMSDWLQETVGMDRRNIWLVKRPRMGWGCLKVYVCQKPTRQDSCG